MVLTEAVAPYYVEAWRRASVNTLEKIECSLTSFCDKLNIRPEWIGLIEKSQNPHNIYKPRYRSDSGSVFGIALAWSIL